MGVNLSALLNGWRDVERRSVAGAIVPALGFLICLIIWLNLSTLAKSAGFAWLILGFAYGWWKTKGFTRMMRFEG